MSAVNCFYKFINVCRRFCVKSVVLIINSRFNCEVFHHKKRSLALPCPVGRQEEFSKKNLFFFKSLVGGYCLFLIPPLGQYSDVPSSFNIFTTWYTVYLATFKSSLISEVVLSEQKRNYGLWFAFFLKV